MASKRVALSVVNWGAISQRVPAKQREAYNVLKNTSDKYVIRIQDLPESLPKIDFADYKAKLPGLSGLVSEFEKQYAAVQVPYPKDSADVKGALLKEEGLVRERSANFIERETHYLSSLETMLKKIESVPPPEKMTLQMFNYYFPENAANPNRENPSIWPPMVQGKQIENLRVQGKSWASFLDRENYRINLDNAYDFEMEWLHKVIEWRKEEHKPKIEAILAGYQKIVDEAMEKHVANLSEDAAKKFMENDADKAAFKQKVLKENGITEEKFKADAVAVIGPIKKIETVKEYVDALQKN